MGVWKYDLGQYGQQNQQQFGFNYYAPPPPQPPAPPGMQRFSGSPFQQRAQAQLRNTAPPPPPPGESKTPSPIKGPMNNNPNLPGTTTAGASQNNGGSFPPLQPPPLPPMFPWMSQALHESMTTSQFGQNFKEEASNLPFVPVVVNDSDLAKMTENVIKEAEQWNNHQLQYYKAVINQDLPQKLKDMFQPLYCKLCTLTLSSPIVAKDHYAGKRHKKGVEAWLIKNPDLSTAKQRQEAHGAAAGADFTPPIMSGTVIKNPEGGLSITGQINGFITNHIADPGAKKGISNNPTPFPSSFENGNRKRPAPAVDNQPRPPSLLSNIIPKPSFIGPQRPPGPNSQSMSQNKEPQSTPSGPDMILRNPRLNQGASSVVPKGESQSEAQADFKNSGNTFQPKKPRQEDRGVGFSEGAHRPVGPPFAAVGQPPIREKGSLSLVTLI